ncbi:electron transfer flavoprotein-ubiquinone oxidoreductase, partial [Vibrio parahaemolyticus AQ3810]
MAIGRNQQESLHKALRGLEVGATGFDEMVDLDAPDALTKIRHELKEAGAERIWYIADAFRAGMSVDGVFNLTNIDRWFLVQIEELVKLEEQEISVCVVEKGSEVGAHILSGAVFETRSLDELFPDWKEKDAPLNTKVNQDKTYYLSNELNGHELPTWAVPNTLHNDGNYIISLGNLCRWMASQAENLGVEIYPGFSACEAIFDDQDRVCGVLTGDMGLDKNGEQKANFEPGIELRA